MIEYKKASVLKLAVMIFVLLLGAILITRVFNPQQATVTIEKSATESNAPAKILSPGKVPATKIEPATPTSKPKLQDLVRLRRSWGPTLTSWYGEMAPDFMAMDLQGKEIKLSAYRGKNVMLIFWATWCGPCVSEIPSLTTLRGMTGEDKLAIIAISNENPEKVKKFAQDRKLNYTVIAYDTSYLPRPFNEINAIPTTFFINPEGKIKIVTEGAAPFNDIRALLEAE